MCPPSPTAYGASAMPFLGHIVTDDCATKCNQTNDTPYAGVKCSKIGYIWKLLNCEFWAFEHLSYRTSTRTMHTYDWWVKSLCVDHDNAFLSTDIFLRPSENPSVHFFKRRQYAHGSAHGSRLGCHFAIVAQWFRILPRKLTGFFDSQINQFSHF